MNSNAGQDSHPAPGPPEIINLTGATAYIGRIGEPGTWKELGTVADGTVFTSPSDPAEAERLRAAITGGLIRSAGVMRQMTMEISQVSARLMRLMRLLANHPAHTAHQRRIRRAHRRALRRAQREQARYAIRGREATDAEMDRYNQEAARWNAVARGWAGAPMRAAYRHRARRR